MQVELTSAMLSSLKGAAGNGPRILTIVSRAERSISGRELCSVYRAAVEGYGQAAEDEAYRELCCRYMAALCLEDVNEAREFHNRQRAFGITSDARMYEARALLEEREGDDMKAMKILQEGLRVGAKPSDLLKRQMVRLQREVSRQADAEQGTQTECTTCSVSTQTAPVARSRPALRCLERLQRVSCLFDSFATWKDLREAARQQRCKALFESLQRQLLLAERLNRSGSQARAWQRISLRAWRSAVEVFRQRQRLADVAFQEELRRRVYRVFMAWRSFRETKELPVLESLLLDLHPRPNQSLQSQNRSPREEAKEDMKRVRGPERFFYDTSSYTGCARYGGPMIVEKKENLGSQRRQSKTGRPERS